MQAVDVTTLSAVLHELRTDWIPARVERVRQETPHTLHLLLRSVRGQESLEISCHPVAARIHLCWTKMHGKAGTRYPFGYQVFQHLGGQVLTGLEQPDWERVAILEFAPRPQAPVTFRLYVEIMGKYSNLLLVDNSGHIVCCAHTVDDSQSRVRPLMPGDVYTPPPPLLSAIPSQAEPFLNWQGRLSLLPIPLEKALIESYRGVSRTLTRQMLAQAGLPGSILPARLTPDEWQKLHHLWCSWLAVRETNAYQPGWTPSGYTVLGWGMTALEKSVNFLLDRYYTAALTDQQLNQQRNRLGQILNSALKKARVKLSDFVTRRDSAEDHASLKEKADLLMAHPQERRPGQTRVVLPSFATEQPVTIPLNPAKDLIENAQIYYRKHRKAHRALSALAPLIARMEAERDYLEGVLSQLEQADLAVLAEIEQELRATGYVSSGPKNNIPSAPVSPYHRFLTPNGLTILCGRNNRQNEEITFRVAQPNDLWFHAQEIPGAHVLLQIPPGQVPEASDLQATANVAAHYSRARQSGQVPVLYTPRHYLRKLKGHLPGLVTYSQFQVLWGKPDILPKAHEDSE
ncbi:Rqc2 family fibronectin-binding protein [Anthocerotibacter panamensis]|uniref:Rqc2 family fibronectin-binding protein n=1 Tax=Anthocerotibacter panamensis TaxID=2857077 RepID=UPI001C4030F7|nr:NFACT RNA binding domain-containing protein [Anthocerotibacter panamensis]